MSDGLAAVFRPQASEIAVYLQHGGRTGHITLGIAEARQLHGTLGGALRHADAVGDPVGAVTQADLWKLRQTVAATVRGDEADAFSPLSRFARRIESGEADDSEPMRVALAVTGAAA